MLKHLALTLALFTSFPLIAQDIPATTEDGRKVTLRKDGTWNYVQAAKPSSTAPKLSKSAGATQKVSAPHGDFAVYLNPRRWHRTKDDSTNKIMFEAASGKGYAMLIGEGITIPTKALKKIALGNAQKMDPNARIVLEEKRVVNNREIICLQMEATSSNVPFTFYGYYYGGSSGTIQLVTFTPQAQFAAVKAELEEFLNGLEITDTPLAEESDVKTVPLNDGKIQVAFDTNKWNGPEKSDGGKLKLVSTNDSGWVLLVPESITYPLDSFGDFAIQNVQSVDPNAKVLLREKRTVNGQEVLCLKISATINSLPFIYYGYYYSGPAGSIQVLAYTVATSFKEIEPDFTELLNSLRIVSPSAQGL